METNTAITIREARPEDSEGILRCLQSTFAAYRTAYTAGAFADTTLNPTTLKIRMKVMTVLVAVTDAGEVVGTVACSVPGDEGHLRGMGVVPAAQGKAVGDRLLRAAEEVLTSRGCSCVTLDTTLLLKRAMRFYERNGYRRTGKVADFFGMELIEFAKRLL
jgi:ribosomal protein S18 acetylase RimI-like enzyme